MPRLPIHYNNTHLYKIISKYLNITECYVGHTTDFTRRTSEHKVVCNNSNSKKYNRRVYQFIRDNGGWDNFQMVLIETCQCNNSLEARREERTHVEELQATLNSNMPSRTLNEWFEDNKDKLKSQRVEYYNTNRSILLMKKSEYYKENKELLAIKNKDYRETHKG